MLESKTHFGLKWGPSRSGFSTVKKWEIEMRSHSNEEAPTKKNRGNYTRGCCQHRDKIVVHTGDTQRE